MTSHTELPSNILLIDKPKGISSFDCIRKLRKELSIRKMGHAGTLDPNATGLLIIGVEEGTKKLEAFLKLPKVYTAEILFGTKTDTGDIVGNVLETKDISNDIDREKIEKELKSLIGTHSYTLPVYSALKQGGEPLYKKARRGEKVIPPTREMTVEDAELLFWNEKEKLATVRFAVLSGTYIRTLGETLGEKLSVPATLKNLRRVSIGDFKVEDARPL